MRNKIFVIAEAGGNHNSNVLTGKKLIKKAKNCGADAVKFQSFKTEDLITNKIKFAAYQKKNIKKKTTPFKMLKNCELSFENQRVLYKYAKKNKIIFLSSAFDIQSLIFLSKSLKIKTHKIPSGEITNYQLLLEHAKHNHNIILSTGMSSLKEIREALNILSFGYLNKKKIPNKKSLKKNYIKKAHKILKKKVVIMHCVSNYPLKNRNSNLNFIKKIKDEFKLNVGYSDHSSSLISPTIAISLGAIIIEKHLTLNKNMNGPDHRISLNPKEFKTMVKNIRQTEIMLGNENKKVNFEELKLRKIARKIIVAKKKIVKGEKFSISNITAKRSSSGICASKFWQLINRKANRNFFKDQSITIWKF